MHYIVFIKKKKMIGNDWDTLLKSVFESKGFNNFIDVVKKKYEENICFPKYENIFNALKLTPYSNVKVVILGQDPYHGVGQAHGLSFSVQKGTSLPPSLQNIYKELYNDLGIGVSTSGDLTSWAKQGVLLLNSVLSVEKDKAASHKDLGWQRLTDYIIELLNLKKEPVVFILWGAFAREKKRLITNPKHFIIESTHPSPFSAYNGFFGSKPFSKTNKFLKDNNMKEIDFKI